MTSIYLMRGDKILLLYRQGGKVVNNVWTGSAGGHFETFELNDAQACVLREMKEEIGLGAGDIESLSLRYVTLRRNKGEISNLTMPYTAQFVMEHYCKIGRFTTDMYVGVADGDKLEFIKMPEF